MKFLKRAERMFKFRMRRGKYCSFDGKVRCLAAGEVIELSPVADRDLYWDMGGHTILEALDVPDVAEYVILVETKFPESGGYRVIQPGAVIEIQRNEALALMSKGSIRPVDPGVCDLSSFSKHPRGQEKNEVFSQIVGGIPSNRNTLG